MPILFAFCIFIMCILHMYIVSYYPDVSFVYLTILILQNMQ